MRPTIRVVSLLAMGLAAAASLAGAHALAVSPPFRPRTGPWNRSVPRVAHPAAPEATSRADALPALALLRHPGAGLPARAASGPSPLHVAVAANSRLAAAFLLDAGIDGSDGPADPPLSMALAAGNQDMARLLIEHGVDPNRPDAEGFTAPGTGGGSA